MAVIIAVAAFAIDAAIWMSRHHKDQVVADSAALAAANCLANPGSTSSSIVLNGTSTTLYPCTTSTDTQHAMTVAKDYALANGVTLTDSQIQIDTTNGHVTVSASTTSPSFFARLFGIQSTTQSAGAQATWVAGNTSCSTPGNSCAAVFAMSSSCPDKSSNPGGSPIMFNGAGDTITGVVHSNGDIFEGTGGAQNLGPTTFGNGTGCKIQTNGGTSDTWNGSSTVPSTGSAPITAWPEDYTKVVTPCGTGYAYTCTGPDGTPSYCTEAAGSAGFSSVYGASSSGFDYNTKSQTIPSGQVWCAYGSGTPSDPTTWNGLIYFQAGSNNVTGNWIGGTIDIGHDGQTLSSPLTTTTSFPVFYATGSGDCTSANSGGVCISGQNETINGSMFAPNGTIEFDGDGTTTKNFLEANQVEFIGQNQTMLGIGPTSLTGSTGGSDSLTQ